MQLASERQPTGKHLEWEDPADTMMVRSVNGFLPVSPINDPPPQSPPPPRV
jgi:hypothetical protein